MRGAGIPVWHGGKVSFHKTLSRQDTKRAYGERRGPVWHSDEMSVLAGKIIFPLKHEWSHAEIVLVAIDRTIFAATNKKGQP